MKSDFGKLADVHPAQAGAIIAYAKTLITVAPGAEISISDITAGRTNGLYATVDITPASMAPTSAAELAQVKLASQLAQDMAPAPKAEPVTLVATAEGVGAKPYTPGERQAKAEIPPGLRNMTEPSFGSSAPAAPAPEKPAKASSPFKGGLTKAKAPEATPAPAPAQDEASSIDTVLTKVYGIDANGVEVSEDPLAGVMDDELDKVGSQEEQVPEEEPVGAMTGDSQADVPAEEPEPAPPTTPKLGISFRKPANAVEEIEQPPAQPRGLSTFSKLHQRRPETAEAAEG